MRRPPIRFATFLIILGLLMGAVVVVDLWVRGLHRFPTDPVWDVPGGEVRLGRAAIIQHGCGSCHVIPGIRTATGRVGPQLVGFHEQIYIAGVLPNTPDHLIDWIRDPIAINPRTAMPNLQVTEDEARHIAAYLYEAR